MENKEMRIIEILEKNKDLSQREIAKKAELSLGIVNTLIKACVIKGLIKIERLNARTIRYLLTPKGINEKSKKTFNYIKRSYGTIMKLKNYFEIKKEDLLRSEIWIYEMEEEMADVIKMILKDIGINYKEYNEKEVNQEDIIIKWDDKKKNDKMILITEIINEN